MPKRTGRDVFAPKQQRSRDTVTRLLKATTDTLDMHGLDDATIPRIAGAAGVAPASVYRRFRDRDALIRAALMHALEQSAAANQATLRLEAFTERTLEGVVGRLVALTLAQYRERPGLMRALTRFVETTTDDDFRARALAVVSRNFETLVDLLLAFRHDIPDPDPRRAITFALLTMATVIEVRALERVSMWHELLPVSDEEMQAAVARNVVAHLRAPRA